jgi:HD-like signal output (HDOD) protein
MSPITSVGGWERVYTHFVIKHLPVGIQPTELIALKEKKDINFTINPENFKEAISDDSDFYIQFSIFSPDAEATLTKVLHMYLEKNDLLYLKGMLLAILKELINNAIKANAKRIYFKLKNLDINNSDDYQLGMENFKQETYNPESQIFTKLIDEKLFVRVHFKHIPGRLAFHVINNSPILVHEFNKIKSRIEKAYAYDDISEAFEDDLDDSEGAGLGLIMSLMLFKNIGLSKETYSIIKNDNLTTSIIDIPQNRVRSTSQKKLADEIIHEVERLPSFPTNVIKIQRLCAGKKSTIQEIAEMIKRDPGLTADILKLANSAGYITSGRTNTIGEAVKKIGLRGINTLVIASGVQKIMESKYKKYEKIWKNSYKRAFYAQRIAIQLSRNKLSEFVYLSALLADIGLIILLSLNPKKAEKIREIAGMKGMESSNLLEEISLGISHNTLGKLMLQKWKFNQALVKAVEFHDRPHMAPDKFKDLIYIVYLANTLSEIEAGKSKYELIDDDVMEHFNIKKRDDLRMIHRILIEAYMASDNTEPSPPQS